MMLWSDAVSRSKTRWRYVVLFNILFFLFSVLFDPDITLHGTGNGGLRMWSNRFFYFLSYQFR